MSVIEIKYVPGLIGHLDPPLREVHFEFYAEDTVGVKITARAVNVNDEEISLAVNGSLVGYFIPGTDGNDPSPQIFDIPAGVLVSGLNEATIASHDNKCGCWGVYLPSVSVESAEITLPPLPPSDLLSVEWRGNRCSIDQNKTRIINSDKNNPHVILVPRFQTTAGKTKTWFWATKLLNAAGRQTTQQIAINNNYGNYVDVAGGYRPWYCYDRSVGTWAPFDNVSLMDSVTMAFSNDTTWAEDVWIAYGPMFGQLEFDVWFNSIRGNSLVHPTTSQLSPVDPFVIGRSSSQVNELGVTAPALSIYGFRLGNDSHAGPKKRAFVTMGIHGGEDYGRYAAKAFVNYLLTSGSLLLEKWDVHVYGLCNPSGIELGHYYGQFDVADMDADPNKEYDAPKTASATAMRDALLTDFLGGPIDLFMSFHSWANRIYGYYGPTGVAAMSYAAEIDRNTGVLHHRYGDNGWRSECWWANKRYGAKVVRVQELGQNVMNDPINQATSCGVAVAKAMTVL